MGFGKLNLVKPHFNKREEFLMGLSLDTDDTTVRKNKGKEKGSKPDQDRHHSQFVV